MITHLKLFESSSFDPWYNLAIEQYLLETAENNTCILYLWQNENTVVIGKNQNAWKECKTALLGKEGGRLARRLSGGGAVFHDLGNLNFTFLMPQAEYDPDRQFAVIIEAMKRCGIHAERSGRNDMLAEGRKFSGNAFYKNGRQAYHHGTLLVDVDKEKLQRYLSPSKAKLQAKGVDSVRSRVVNLTELNPDLTIQGLKQAMEEAFRGVYGLIVQRIPESELDLERINSLFKRNESWEWNYGKEPPFTFSCEGRLSFGEIQILAQVKNGTIMQAGVYTDAMDWEIAPVLEKHLTGCRLRREELMERLGEIGEDRAEEICNLLLEQDNE